MELPQVLSSLPSSVRTQFEAARTSNALTYYPTEVSLIKINNIPFQLRFSRALAHKSKSEVKSSDNKNTFDPFDNPPKDLFITDILPSHFLVLNKFAIVPEHFILATKDFKEQTHLLEEDDLGASYACIKAWHENEDRKELYAFFNSGEHSGASQRHRHLQFLPVESMKTGLPSDSKWEVLADSLLTLDPEELPFSYFVAPIPQNVTPQQLFGIYHDLYMKAAAIGGTSERHHSNISEIDNDGSTMISYNLAMTISAMVICPRRVEGSPIYQDGKSCGFVALNGTLLAGTLLVKNETEWNLLRSDHEQLEKVLQSIGFPKSITANERL